MNLSFILRKPQDFGAFFRIISYKIKMSNKVEPCRTGYTFFYMLESFTRCNYIFDREYYKGGCNSCKQSFKTLCTPSASFVITADTAIFRMPYFWP